MKECNVIAIDLAKDKFQVCIMNKKGKIIFNKELTRQKLISWLPQQAVSLVAMAAKGLAFSLSTTPRNPAYSGKMHKVIYGHPLTRLQAIGHPHTLPLASTF